jgi:hypothetical protein
VKSFLSIVLLSLISFSVLKAQKKVSEKSVHNEINARVVSEFTGEVQNQFDSVFYVYIEVDESSLEGIESFVHDKRGKQSQEVYDFRGNKWNNRAGKDIVSRTSKREGKVKIPLGKTYPDFSLDNIYFEDVNKNKVKVRFTR